MGGEESLTFAWLALELAFEVMVETWDANSSDSCAWADYAPSLKKKRAPLQEERMF